jgi:sphingomyelin phosphodiesterase 2
MRHAAQLGRTVIAMGDFNSTPQSVPIKLIREHTGMQDAWLVTHPGDPGECIVYDILTFTDP